MKKYIIYLHKNKINGKCYVGQTCQKPETRWGKDGWHYHEQEYFYRAIQKYGWDNFEHIILETNIDEDKVDERECYWGGYYHALAPEGYSLSLGKNNNKIHSTESAQTKSEAALKKWQNDEYRKKVIKGRQTMWQEATPECREKMLANLKRDGTGGKTRSKKVQCIETGIIYNSTREAERQTGVKHNNISQVCTGKRQTAGKLHWRYIEQ